jgi:hypothetical protein
VPEAEKWPQRGQHPEVGPRDRNCPDRFAKRREERPEDPVKNQLSGREQEEGEAGDLEDGALDQPHGQPARAVSRRVDQGVVGRILQGALESLEATPCPCHGQGRGDDQCDPLRPRDIEQRWQSSGQGRARAGPGGDESPCGEEVEPEEFEKYGRAEGQFDLPAQGCPDHAPEKRPVDYPEVYGKAKQRRQGKKKPVSTAKPRVESPVTIPSSPAQACSGTHLKSMLTPCRSK